MQELNKYGRLTAMYIFRKKDDRKYVNCVCDCGVEKSVRFDSLISGITKSCGCLQRDKFIANNLKHGLSKLWQEDNKGKL